MNRAVLACVLVLGLGGFGCSALTDFSGYTYGNTDGGGSQDGGGNADASHVDGGHVDAGNLDAGNLDAGNVDAGPDSGVDGGPPPVRRPTGIIQTSGGALLMSSSYRLRITIGAPQPMGSGSDATHHLVVGPEGL